LMNQYVLVLVTLNADRVDAVGNNYPTMGLVQALNFTNSKNILEGLFGILWGRAGTNSYLKCEEDSIWVIVKVDSTRNLVHIDTDVIKFKTGFVLFSSSNHSEAAEFIAQHRKNNGDCFDLSQIAGYTDKANIPNKNVWAQECDGSAESDIPGLYSIASGIATTCECDSHAISIGHNGKAGTDEDDSHAVTLNYDSVAYSCGDDSKSVAVNGFSQAIANGENGLAVCLSPDGVCSAGDNGCIVMAYKSLGKIKFAVGYVGQDVESHMMYNCNDGKFIPVKNLEN